MGVITGDIRSVDYSQGLEIWYLFKLPVLKIGTLQVPFLAFWFGPPVKEV